jgi:hypothetical protein
MGAVADFVEDTVDFAGDVVESVGDVAESVVEAAADAVEDVAETVGDTVQAAIDDPIGTMASVAAIATQQYYLLPAISAGKVVANGGDLDDALKAAAITYVAGEVGGAVGDQVSTAAQYGTELGSAQTAMLAAQNAGMGMGTALGGAAGATIGAGTGALLSGGDVGQAMLSGLYGYGSRLGMNLATNAIGQVVNEVGDVIADSYDQLEAMMGEEYGDQPGDFPTTSEDLAIEDAFLGQTADQPGDFPTTEADLALEDELMGQIGDQPGDYDTTPEEMAASEGALSMIPDALPEEPIGDQEGDFPLNEEELRLADEELAQLPAAEQYADQPGDYDTTAEEMAASEEALASMPDAQTDLNLKGVQDYFTNQYKNAFLKNLLGSSSGAMTKAVGNKYGISTTPGLQGFNINYEGEEEETPSISAPAQTSDLSLFDPVGDASWAPQTKLSGLGFAGKFINQEDNTYYLNPEQARKEKEAEDNYQFGWDTGMDEEADSQYYNYDPTDIEYAAEGGQIGHNPQFFSEGGMGNRYVRGDGDGTSDSVPAMLASGEFVIPADVVSGLGNGDNDAGAHVLDQFMQAIRKHKRAADPSELPEDSKGPLSYLEEAMKKARK